MSTLKLFKEILWLEQTIFSFSLSRGMIDYAFTHEEVNAVIAHTLAEKNASTNVLQKVGMTFSTELDNPEVGKIWRWQIARDDYR